MPPVFLYGGGIGKCLLGIENEQMVPAEK